MPFKKAHVVVEGVVFVAPDAGDHPAFPIYIPIDPPTDVYPPGIWGGADEPFPTPPIYFPVGGNEIWGGGNEPFPTPPIFIPIVPPHRPGHPAHPIYYPVEIWGDIETPEHPIVLPPDLPPEVDKEALKAFLYGNLPPFDPPDYVAPTG